MAFATANVKKEIFGGLKVTYGDWSGSAGDAAGTVTVEGGRIFAALFSQQDSTNPADQPAVHTASTSGAVTTLKVSYEKAVTNGRFLIIHS